ncbi:acyl-CoA dehydrogenase family protein [Nesterenkonia muleiensis]|uniref:acyl-CoA dehydrogenase family protein n=1 Tax=Nesterenkonia muleiensis TaxID=2282648 RepID=UPI00192E5558|nr:acyl-CoA dehydrogenase family protein [Nesterenkonia muleiensis]
MSRAIDVARTLIAQGQAELPLPGKGDTGRRWRELIELGRKDLTAARLVEAHADASAICADLEVEDCPDRASLWGVWAAEPPTPVLEAVQHGGVWKLRGTKLWCSAAGFATHALVTAQHSGRSRLFSVDLRQAGVTAGEKTWASSGMAETETAPMHFDGVSAVPAGDPDSYLDRPGFWHGGLGVACCWWGGAQGLIDMFCEKARRRDDPHTLAHLGACLAWDETITNALTSAAQEIDANPGNLPAARRRALSLRSVVERGCADVIRRFGKALGASPLAEDHDAARLVQDLQVYIRQSHAEADDAQLARYVLATEDGRRR